MTKPLKFSPTIERDIVALCLTDTTFFIDVHEHLKPGHFTDEFAGQAYSLIQGYFGHYHLVPEWSRLEYFLNDNEVEIPEEWKPEKVPDREWLLEQTLTLIRHQEFKSFIFDCADESEKEKPNFDRLEQDLQKILSIQPISDLGLFYFDLDERYVRLTASKGERIKTGIEVVDQALEGGLAKEELVCFAGPSGAGKSYLLAIAGAHMLVKEKKNVVHYTLEMSEERTSLRYDMAVLAQTKGEIMDDIEGAKNSLKNIKTVLNKNLVVKGFPTMSANANTLRTHLFKLREQQRFFPDVIIVDYGDIMDSRKKFSSKYDTQGAVFQDLRALAQEFKVPVLTATQTNRGAVGKAIIGQEDLGDSYDKARIMDALFTIVQKPEEKEDGYFKLYEAKVRNEQSGRLWGYQIDYARAQLEFIAKVEEEDE
jgi:archaellum biogenesis ATPase FlaH